MNAHRYPVWASLARDHLAIMASSVSSECAFSSAGITISKRQNRLKVDIVEALQFLKCLIQQDLVFRADPSVTVDSEVDLEDDDDSLVGSSNQLSAGTEKSSSWDDLWLEDVGDAVTDG